MIEGPKPSYMLLPTFDYGPGKHIQLGTLLAPSSQTKRPDPTRPLNADERIAPTKIENGASESGRIFQGTDKTSIGGGIWADIPVLSAIAATLHFNKSDSTDLTIDCESLETDYFLPSPDYFIQSLKSFFIKKYTTGGGVLYMVTGIKTAKKAVIEHTVGKTIGGKGKLGVDGSGAGVPARAGIEGEGSRDGKRTRWYRVEGPFIFAYQLRKIKLKDSGEFSETDFNKFALLNDDDGKRSAGVSNEELIKLWKIEYVGSPNEF